MALRRSSFGQCGQCVPHSHQVNFQVKRFALVLWNQIFSRFLISLSLSLVERWTDKAENCQERPATGKQAHTEVYALGTHTHNWTATERTHSKWPESGEDRVQKAKSGMHFFQVYATIKVNLPLSQRTAEKNSKETKILGKSNLFIFVLFCFYFIKWYLSYMLHFLHTHIVRLMDGRLHCMASERIPQCMPKYHCHLMLISNSHRLANALICTWFHTDSRWTALSSES